MTMEIVGIGTATPPHTMTQSAAAELAGQVCCETARQQRFMETLYRMSGVSQRHLCVPHETATRWLAEHSGGGAGSFDRSAAVMTEVSAGPTTQERMALYREHSVPLAEEAAQAALYAANMYACDITHLVTVSCTGFYAPGIDIELIERLGMPATTERVHVGFMGCHGAINGLRAANALASSLPDARVLLCAVELCSLHYAFRWDANRMVGNALFADGAAAVVGFHSDGDSGGSGPGAWRIGGTGSCRIPDSMEAMSWEVGNHGFEMLLSPEVPEIIARELRGWLTDWLADFGLTLDTVGSWAIHPGGPKIVEAVADTLELGEDAIATSQDILARYGNMSSPTVLFILDALRQRQAPAPIVVLAFGPGLTAEAALIL